MSHLMTSRRSMPLLIAALVCAVVGCAEAHPTGDAAVVDATGDAPRTCSISSTAPYLVLEPASDNPASCRTPAPCELWFGHGQHLRCPRYLGPPSPIEVACDLGFGDERCVCDDGRGFVADFATSEVVHVVEGVTCRYRITPDEAP